MSTTVTYKGNTITTVNNNTKTLTTAGKYLEANVILTDITGQSGSSGYTRTVIVPEQTVTPDSSRRATISGVTDGFVDASHYIVTLDGVEWYVTCETLWGTNLTVGEVQWFLSTPSDYVYPFGAIYVSGEDLTVAFADTNQHTVKIEKLELNGSGGGGGSATLITKTITTNGTYSAEDDDADGYSSVIVNVLLSRASSWTKVAETSYQISTTNTAVQTVATWATGSSDLWTSSKWVYVRIRDTAGKREGYYYGGDQFFYNTDLINGTSSTYIGTAMNRYIRYTEESQISASTSTIASLYGVYVDRLYSNGDLRIRSRYHSTNSLTINGTFKVEVYLLNPADENITDGIVVKSIDEDYYVTSVDYYGEVLPRYIFGAGRGDNEFTWSQLRSIDFKSQNVYLTWGNFFYCGLYELSTSAIKGRDPSYEWKYNKNSQSTSCFRNMKSLVTLSLPEFVGFLNHYEIAACTALKTVYLPKVTKVASYGSNGRGAFRDDTSLESVQLGSVGFAVDAIDTNPFQNCTQTGLTITIYTTGSYVDTAVANTRRGATNATIIIKASEATTYGGTSYSEGDTIVTSTP